jgi:hypothetical protein
MKLKTANKLMEIMGWEYSHMVNGYNLYINNFRRVIYLPVKNNRIKAKHIIRELSKIDT